MDGSELFKAESMYFLCIALKESICIFALGHYFYYYNYYYYNYLGGFSHQPQPMVSHWSLSDSKSPQVSRTLLSILADITEAVVRIVSTRPVISKSSSPFTNSLVTVPSAAIKWYHCHFHVLQFFSIPWQGRSFYLCFDFLLILLCSQPG